MRPVRFMYGPSSFLAFSPFDACSPSSEEEARAMARAMIDSPDMNPSEWMPGHKGLEAELVDALLTRRIALLPVYEPPRLLDPPKTVDLASLQDNGEQVVEPPRPTAWVSVEVVDQRGRPLPFFEIEVEDPTGGQHRLDLDDAAKGRLDDLAEDGGCTFRVVPAPDENHE